MGWAGADEVAFGAYRLSVRERTLCDGGGPVALPSRAFDVLLALIEARSGVVSKDELMRRVWGRIVVQENNLHVQIAAVRRALGPQSRDIQTVPGRGYRFIGAVDSEADADLAAAPAPPARSWRPRLQGNLPAPLSGLIGRGPELAAACALFDEARLVTVVGPPGVGKTKLAQSVAARLAPRFGQGCWWVDLAQAPGPGLVAAEVAVALGLDVGPPAPERLAEALQPQDALLVLDGCEHVLEAVAVLARRLLQRCPRLRILCASQAPLGLEGEQVRRLAPLELPPRDIAPTAAAALAFGAVRLFAERAGAVDGRFVLTDDTAAAVVQVCRELDGLPLAIELAAARAPLIGLEPLRADPAERLALLDDDWRDTPWRRRALRAAVERSLRLLSEPDRQVLRRLAALAGSFTLDQAREAAAGGGLTRAAIVRAVGALAQRSMLMVRPDLARPRYWVLQVVRDVVRQPAGLADALDWPDVRHALSGLERSLDPWELRH